MQEEGEKEDKRVPMAARLGLPMKPSAKTFNNEKSTDEMDDRFVMPLVESRGCRIGESEGVGSPFSS